MGFRRVIDQESQPRRYNPILPSLFLTTVKSKDGFYRENHHKAGMGSISALPSKSAIAIIDNHYL